MREMDLETAGRGFAKLLRDRIGTRRQMPETRGKYPHRLYI